MPTSVAHLVREALSAVLPKKTTDDVLERVGADQATADERIDLTLGPRSIDQELLRTTGNPCLPIQLARAVPVTLLEPYVHLFGDQPDMRGRMLLSQWLNPTFLSHVRPRLVVTNDEACYRQQWHGGTSWALECFLGALSFRSLRKFNPSVPFRRIELPGPEEGRRAEAENFYGCHVEFGFSHHAMVFDAAHLDEPHQGHGPANHLRQWALDLRKQLEMGDPLAQLERRYREAVTRGCADQPAVALHLGLPVTDLKHLLRNVGVSHHDLLDDARRFVTMRLLVTESGSSVQEVARSIGMAGKAVLIRAFHRWLGLSPGQFRERYAYHNAWWLSVV
jgi:AraC-like DNA-binding protein